MRNPDRQTIFKFKQFEVSNCRSAMKIGTDGVLLGAWAFDGYSAIDAQRKLRILDVGCGTGVLALMMAQRFEHSMITGVEIDPAACEEACANFNNSYWKHRLNARCCDFKDFVSDSETGCFDLIICNPPFFTNGALSPDESRRVARHEGALSLERLIAASASLLSDNGRLAFVSAAEHCSRIDFLATVNHLEIARICMVKTTANKTPRRVMCEMVKRPAGELPMKMSASELTIRKGGGEYTTDYVSLVESFYIKI